MTWRCSKCKKLMLPSRILPSGMCISCDVAEAMSRAKQNRVVSDAPPSQPVDVPTESPNIFSLPQCQTSQKESGGLSYADKEKIAVQRITMHDMMQFTSLPYLWSGRIEKSVVPNGHPFAYMELTGENADIAMRELDKMNRHFHGMDRVSALVPGDLSIPIDKLVFSPGRAPEFSKLICTPFTYAGSISKYPATLQFTTSLDSGGDSTHGELSYGASGSVERANVNFWRNCTGYFFYYETVGHLLTLSKITSTCSRDSRGLPSVIYKGPHIIEAERQREIEAQDFSWVQEHIPDKSPKSLSGFRRMKAQNTKNYQALKQLAQNMGREI